MKKTLDRGKLQVIEFFPAVKVYRVCSEEIGHLDPKELSFFNINTPDDMNKARQLLKGLRGSQGQEG